MWQWTHDLKVLAYAYPELLLGFLGTLVLAGLATAFYTLIVSLARSHREELTLSQFTARFLTPVVSALRPDSEASERQLRLLLTSAGLRSEQALTRFLRIQVITLVVGVTIGIFLLSWLNFQIGLIVLAGCAYGGMKAPEFYFGNIAKGRRMRLMRATPHLVDLMVLCLDVGLSIEAAFERVTREMSNLEPIMSEEAELMLAEINAGLPFSQALKRLAERANVEDLTAVARLVAQASALGASVGGVLRDFALAAQVRRTERAEEHAGKVAGLLVMPLTVCLMPASIIIMMAPGIITVMSHGMPK